MLPKSVTDAAEHVAALLTERGQTVAVAESSAGGLIAAALVARAGASRYFAGGLVVYTRPGAEAMLADALALEADVRSASPAFAAWLAAATALKHGADWGVGETGAAGPGGNRYGDPAGHACLAIARGTEPAAAEHVLTGDTDRQANMERFATRALLLLADTVRTSGPTE